VGAATALRGGLRGAGALGPPDAFGVKALEAGCAEVGLTRVWRRGVACRVSVPRDDPSEVDVNNRN